MKFRLFILLMIIWKIGNSQGIELPPQFEDVAILVGLQDPSSIVFSPDNRLFISERITGNLRVAVYDSLTYNWDLLPTPFYTFDVPSSEHRSSGLRGITFDPDFENNGYVYAFYMKDNPRHNRVVRIQEDSENPNEALGTETLLLDVPFNNSTSSGSHNGGDLAFGLDEKLYFTTGDGWNGGDNVQSLSTFTGKLFRLNADGSIPEDNPFYDDAVGDYRAIYALGLRNPYTISCVPDSGNIYINDAVGTAKATVYQILSDSSSAAANFGHDGYSGIGISTDQWANVGVGGSKLITGGAWYPENGYWPVAYRGSYFAAMWGSNSNNPGKMVQVVSESNTSASIFASNVMVPPGNKPVMTEVGPDFNLYYLMTDYNTGDGQINMIKYSGQPVVSAPEFYPLPGQYDDTISIGISSNTPNADIYYTFDGSVPDSTSMLYSDSILISADSTIRAIAYADTLLPSAISTGFYDIGPVENVGPVADAGPDLIVEKAKVVTLNGSASFDPDGSPLELMESWSQIDGPSTTLLDDDETVSNFTPMLTGTYTFRIYVLDVDGAIDSADARITVVDEITDVFEGIIARWSCEEGLDTIVEDTSPNANRGVLQGAAWDYETADSSDFAIVFDGNDDLVDLKNIDITGEEMTICFWTKIQAFNTHDARFISKANGQYDDDHLWMVSSLNDTKLRFRLNTNPGGTTTLISDENILNLDEWMHIAAIYDGVEMKLYKNGLLVTSVAKTGDVGTDPTMNAALGNQPADAVGGARPFNGLMDEIRIYGKALSVSELDSVMTANVEKCNSLVVNDINRGNGSFRRAVACAQSHDTIVFQDQINTIQVLENAVAINNSMTIIGNSDYSPIIHNTLTQPGITVGQNVEVDFDYLNFQCQFGSTIFNAGIINVYNALIKSFSNSNVLPLIQNSGEVNVLGDFNIEK